MDPVIIVSGNWIKKNIYVFNSDSRGCRVLHLDDKPIHEEFAKSVLDDYGFNELRHQIQLSYMFSNKALKIMVHDTPPVNVSNTRQLQGFLSLKKIEKLRLCVEITDNKDDEMNWNDRARETSKKNSVLAQKPKFQMLNTETKTTVGVTINRALSYVFVLRLGFGF